MTRFVLAIVLLASSLGAAANETPNLAPVEKWLAFQRSVRAVEADFIQVRELRALRNGLRSEGKVWVDYSDKRFRWQTGDAADPKTIAVKSGSILTVIQPGRKRAERIDLRSAKANQGPGAAFDFATGELPDTLAELRAAFTILDVKAENDVWRVRLAPIEAKLRDSLTEVVFLIDAERFYLRGFELTFRDRSAVKTTFTRQMFNPSLDAALFAPDLSGYSIKE